MWKSSNMKTTEMLPAFFISLFSCYFLVTSGASINGGYPAFTEVNCTAPLCVEVLFNDGSVDKITAFPSKRSDLVLKGRLGSTGRKAVIILSDDYDSEITIVFKTDKAKGCTRFSVENLGGLGKTTCLDHAPLPENGMSERMLNERTLDYLPEDRSLDRSLEEIQLDPRELNPNGYNLKVAVYYDDMFADQFLSSAVTRVEAVMAIVDEMYSEKDTLKTEIDVDTIAVEHAKGENWGTKSWSREVLCSTCPTGKISESSPHDANLYVFLTGSKSKGGLGLAWLGTLCNSSRKKRNSINKYAAGSQKGGDAYTAETIAHEMGHNIGLAHDCKNGNCAYWSSSYVGPRVIDGKECFGYMDYKDDTNYWSACSVADLTAYINKQQNGFCLEQLNGKVHFYTCN